MLGLGLGLESGSGLGLDHTPSAQSERRLERVRRGQPGAHLEREHRAELRPRSYQRAHALREGVVSVVEGFEEHKTSRLCEAQG